MNRTARRPVAVLAMAALANSNAFAQAADDDGGVLFRADVELVEVYASVFDRRGRGVQGLTADRFKLFDNGAAQEIAVFEAADRRLSCAIVLDSTGSMADALPFLKRSVGAFIDAARPGDEFAVYSFHSSVELLENFSADKQAAKRAVHRLRPLGMTALFDALARVSRDLSAREGKKAIVVFTDGDDNASVLGGAGAVSRARLTGVPVYTIAFGQAARSKPLLESLTALAQETGGLAFEARKPERMGELFDEILRNLASTYLLAYRPPPPERAGHRAISVAVEGPERPVVRARKGYFAAGP